MSPPPAAAFKGFDDPMQVVDRIDIAYEERLAILQEWQTTLAHAASGDDRRNAVVGAIHALEMGAAVQDDGPVGAPDEAGYGAGDPVAPSRPAADKA